MEFFWVPRLLQVVLGSSVPESSPYTGQAKEVEKLLIFDIFKTIFCLRQGIEIQVISQNKMRCQTSYIKEWVK